MKLRITPINATRTLVSYASITTFIMQNIEANLQLTACDKEGVSTAELSKMPRTGSIKRPNSLAQIDVSQ